MGPQSYSFHLNALIADMLESNGTLSISGSELNVYGRWPPRNAIKDDPSRRSDELCLERPMDAGHAALERSVVMEFDLRALLAVSGH